jgi:hypothetical protein
MIRPTPHDSDGAPNGRGFTLRYARRHDSFWNEPIPLGGTMQAPWTILADENF